MPIRTSAAAITDLAGIRILEVFSKDDKRQQQDGNDIGSLYLANGMRVPASSSPGGRAGVKVIIIGLAPLQL